MPKLVIPNTDRPTIAVECFGEDEALTPKMLAQYTPYFYAKTDIMHALCVDLPYRGNVVGSSSDDCEGSVIEYDDGPIRDIILYFTGYSSKEWNLWSSSISKCTLFVCMMHKSAHAV